MESDWLVLNEVIGGMLFTVVIGSFLKRYHARKFSQLSVKLLNIQDNSTRAISFLPFQN